MKLTGKAHQIQLILESLIAAYGEDAKMVDIIREMAVK